MDNVEGYTVVFRQTEDVILAEAPALQGCFSNGRTREEARERVRDAILNFLDELKESGDIRPAGPQG
jgi:predicted RNase H-like HicB family nuclease